MYWDEISSIRTREQIILLSRIHANNKRYCLVYSLPGLWQADREVT